jgi:hypothetical protein
MARSTSALLSAESIELLERARWYSSRAAVSRPSAAVRMPISNSALGFRSSFPAHILLCHFRASSTLVPRRSILWRSASSGLIPSLVAQARQLVAAQKGKLQVEAACEGVTVELPTVARA